MKRRPPIPKRSTSAPPNTDTLSLVAQLPPEAFARYEVHRQHGMSIKDAYAEAIRT